MKLIIILTSVLLALYCNAESDTTKANGLNVFGIVIDVPIGYKATRQGDKSSVAYFLVNPSVNVDGENIVGYVTYSHINSCGELCSTGGVSKFLTLNSTYEVDGYTVSKHTSNDLAQVEVYSIRNQSHVLVVSGDKVLFDSLLLKLGVAREN